MIVLCDRWTALQPRLRSLPRPFRFLQLSNSPACHRLVGRLQGVAGGEELSRSSVSRAFREGFRESYIALLARLNARHGEVAWQLCPFATKNPLSTSLCRNTFWATVIAKLARQDHKPLIVVTDSVPLAQQMAAWGRQVGVPVASAVQGTAPLKRWLTYRLPMAIMAAWLRTMVAAAIARSLRPDRRDRRPALVVTTTLPQSVVGPEGYREAYFGPVVEYLRTSGRRACIFAILLNRPVRRLMALRRVTAPLPLVPVEACLTLKDLAVCGWRGLRQWGVTPQLHEEARIDGVDVWPLIRQAMRESYATSSFFKHLCIRAAARRLAQWMSVQRWLYPFENRALEKALLLGVRAASPQTRLVGCQHAALTLSHTNFILGEGEAQATPLPDTVMLAGAVVKTWLEQEGRFPAGLLQAGCALRQNGTLEKPLRPKPGRLTHVLVALASGMEEYVDTLAFLTEAFRGRAGYAIRLRPHPEFPLAVAERLIPQAQDMRYDVSAVTLAEDLAWAHVVLYASSTVGFQAVSQGIAAVHLELGHPLNTDPLFGQSAVLKWTAEQPQELETILQQIEAMSEAQFQECQRRSRAYAESYFRPVTQARLRMMIEGQ